MNTNVNLEISTLLKDMGFDRKCSSFYDVTSSTQINEAPLANYNLTKQSISIPTIAEVVMWLYEKHGIWVQGPFPLKNGKWEWVVFFLKEPLEGSDGFKNRMSIVDETPYYDTPTEAYSSAIEYVLKKIIPTK